MYILIALQKNLSSPTVNRDDKYLDYYVGNDTPSNKNTKTIDQGFRP